MKILIVLIASCLSTFVYAQSLEIGTLGGNYSIGREINDSGQIVGEAETSQGHVHAFLWKNGTIQDLGTYESHTFSMANAINNKGEVVGYGRELEQSGTSKALFWNKHGKVFTLPAYHAEDYSQASDLNDLGLVVGVSGTQAIAWKNFVPLPLPGLGGDFSIALGVNNLGAIVGYSQLSTGEIRAVLWIDNLIFELGTLGGKFSVANAINDEGIIVGSSENEKGEVRRVVWNGSNIFDLGPGMLRNVSSNSWIAGEDTSARDSLIFRQKWSPSTRKETTSSFHDSGLVFGINSYGDVVGAKEVKVKLPVRNGIQKVLRAVLWKESLQ